MFVIDPTTLSPDVVSAIAAVGGAIVVKLLEYAVNKKDTDKKITPRTLEELQIELDSCRAENIRLRFEKQSLESEIVQAADMSDSDEHRIENLTAEVKKLQKKITKHIDDAASNGSK